MILDNKNENQKVYEWLREYTESGKMDIVTGYFTIGALAYLSRQINKKIKNFRMVLGDVEKDIEYVMQGKAFEALRDTQKEQVITELHNRWSDPNTEIVKRMNSFAEKSPEILKPILEGSK